MVTSRKTKIVVRSIMAIALMFAFALSLNASTLAVSVLHDKVTNEEEAALKTLESIDSINDEIVYFQMLLNELSVSQTTEIEHIENQINQKRQLMYELGAEEVSDEFLLELLDSSIEEAQESGIISRAWHPSEIINRFKDVYTITGTTISYNGKSQYHLVFTYNQKGSYLHKITTAHKVYNAFSAGSTFAQNFVNDILEILASRLIGQTVQNYPKYIQFFPFELFFPSKPEANYLSSSGNALVATLNTTSTHKFVYVLNASTNEWKLCVSTNRVSVAETLTSAISYNGVSTNKSKNKNTMVYGEWNSASADADKAYNGNFTYNTNITKIELLSAAKGTVEIRHNIHNPQSPNDMI